MSTRSGQQCIQSHKCNQCNKYYSNPEFDNKCSVCFGLNPILPNRDNIELLRRCEEWAKSRVADEEVGFSSCALRAADLSNTILYRYLCLTREEIGGKAFPAILLMNCTVARLRS